MALTSFVASFVETSDSSASASARASSEESPTSFMRASSSCAWSCQKGGSFTSAVTVTCADEPPSPQSSRLRSSGSS
eukprot:CAMPEP_0197697304 /NCGR_PEP_ID=MMETSP1338-20131121/117791_1 /TAXON_ID=43686 ORGANISM="Pelagodinium beii, Strain RCC1491" /NCGR_SAMPLE_ID=MMETSP1338 /ASSEMBLY_ACC=CAM_ASM_000754 /LENGTH=76 /DNA_ID=CAMNT_0043280549 /DNA_START=202 /DNA_END=432 /DNA_ORIENTATION=-